MCLHCSVHYDCSMLTSRMMVSYYIITVFVRFVCARVTYDIIDAMWNKGRRHTSKMAAKMHCLGVKGLLAS